MIRILLSCAGGMSSGILMERMRDTARAQGKEIRVRAVGLGQIAGSEGEFDVLLLAPQVSYALEEMKRKYRGQVPVCGIRPVDYGRMNSAAVLAHAEALAAAFEA